MMPSGVRSSVGHHENVCDWIVGPRVGRELTRGTPERSSTQIFNHLLHAMKLAFRILYRALKPPPTSSEWLVLLLRDQQT